MLCSLGAPRARRTQGVASARMKESKSVRPTAKSKSAKAAGKTGKTARKAAGKPVAKAARKTATRSTRSVPSVLRVVEAALADMKAVDVRVLDVRGMSDVADFMVIASGNSDRHLRSIADRVVQMAKASGQRPLGIEGEQQGEWVLVDLPDVMVHVMLPRTREFYQLEHLWEAPRGEGKRAGNGRSASDRA